MRTLLIIKINPCLRSSQQCSKAKIRTTLSNSELKNPDKTFCIDIVGGSPRSTHRQEEAFLEEELPGLFSAILLALITVPDASWHLKGHHLDRTGHQVCAHMVIT